MACYSPSSADYDPRTVISKEPRPMRWEQGMSTSKPERCTGRTANIVACLALAGASLTVVRGLSSMGIGMLTECEFQNAPAHVPTDQWINS